MDLLIRLGSLAPRLLMALILVAACNSVNSSPVAPLSITNIDNGRTLKVQVGQDVDVKLVSTYWSVPQSSDSTVLGTVAPVVVVPTPSCSVGAGCGVLVESFKALHAGRADVTSGRTVCGEDLKCKPGEMYFRVTVVVSPPN